MTPTVPPVAISLLVGLMVIVLVSYTGIRVGYAGQVLELDRVEIFGAARVWVQVGSSAIGTGRVAEMVDPHTSTFT